MRPYVLGLWFSLRSLFLPYSFCGSLRVFFLTDDSFCRNCRRLLRLSIFFRRNFNGLARLFLSRSFRGLCDSLTRFGGIVNGLVDSHYPFAVCDYVVISRLRLVIGNRSLLSNNTSGVRRSIQRGLIVFRQLFGSRRDIDRWIPRISVKR